MTSGNVSDEPIAFDDADALERLSRIADRFLVHDRPIATRTDDSVVRVVRERPLLLRRSRGYVPGALELPIAASQAPARRRRRAEERLLRRQGRSRAWPSHHIGDVKNYETLTSLRDGVAHFEALFEVAPEVVAHDLHPDYLSTRYAQEREGVEFVGVQHHHAHLAATLAEHGETGPAVGAIYDGTGLGTDGTIWGGEILARRPRRTSSAPGASPACGCPAARARSASRGGWRARGSTQMREPLPPAFEPIPQPRWNMVARMVADRHGLAVHVERRPAVRRGRGDVRRAPRGQLRGPGRRRVRGARRSRRRRALSVRAAADPAGDHEPAARDPGGARRPRRRRAGVDDLGALPRRARARHGRRRACSTAERADVDLVVLSGGVFQNRLLLELTAAGLEDAGLRVLVPERLPPNDGQIAFGQVAVAAARGST